MRLFFTKFSLKFYYPGSKWPPCLFRVTACCRNIYPTHQTSLSPLIFTVLNFQIFQQLLQQLIKNLLLASTLALSKRSSPSRLVSFWETQPGYHWGCKSLQHTSVFILTCQISCTCSQCYHTFQPKILLINHPSGLLSPSGFWSLYISFLWLILQNIATCNLSMELANIKVTGIKVHFDKAVWVLMPAVSA